MTDAELAELGEFLKKDIPFIPERVKTFFDIGGFNYKEVIISNFYAYYFNPNEQHGFGMLFLDALVYIINKGEPLFPTTSLDSFTVETESRTDDKGRIDILLRDDNENAIIIENKINATLYNNLHDYYNSTRVKGNKIGIVLSLRKENPKHGGFINILHYELVAEIESRLGNYVLGASLDSLSVLKAFFQNLKNMTNSNISQNDFDFYLENKKKIDEVIMFKNNTDNFIISELSKIRNTIVNIEMINMSNKKIISEKEYKYIRSNYSLTHLDLAIVNDEKIVISIYLDYTGMKYINEIKEELENHKYKKSISYTRPTNSKDWYIIARVSIDLTSELKENLSEHVYFKISESGILEIFKTVLSYFQVNLSCINPITLPHEDH